MTSANINFGKMAPRRSANEIDRHVGARMRERRVMMGLTQQKMAVLAGVSYQQLHKYEQAKNRLAASRLHDMATAMGVDVTYFFEGLEPLEPYDANSPPPRHADLIELLQNFLAMSQGQRQGFSGLARVLAEDPGGEDSTIELVAGAGLAKVA